MAKNKRNSKRKPTKRLITKISNRPSEISSIQSDSGSKLFGSNLFQDIEFQKHYPWYTTSPSNAAFVHSKHRDNGTTPNAQPRKLFEICTDYIASNADVLDPSCLHIGGWEVWKKVWERILYQQNDSFRVFNMFASAFSKRMDFKCHGFPNNALAITSKKKNKYSQEYRKDAIYSNILPNCRFHRLDSFFSNIEISGFISKMNALTFDSSLLLDVSFLRDAILKDDLIRILTIENLAALDLSQIPHIDDSFLHIISVCIREGRLHKLELLRITGCNEVTEKGLRELMHVANAENSSLSLIETDIAVLSSNFASDLQHSLRSPILIAGTDWTYLQGSDEARLLARIPLGLKFHMFYKLFKKAPMGNKITLDIFLYRKALDSNADISEQLNDLWKIRSVSRKGSPAHSTGIYIRKDAMVCCKSSRVSYEPRNVGPSGKQDATKSTKRKKLNPSIKLNAKDFFTVS